MPLTSVVWITLPLQSQSPGCWICLNADTAALIWTRPQQKFRTWAKISAFSDTNSFFKSSFYASCRNQWPRRCPAVLPSIPFPPHESHFSNTLKISLTFFHQDELIRWSRSQWLQKIYMIGRGVQFQIILQYSQHWYSAKCTSEMKCFQNKRKRRKPCFWHRLSEGWKFEFTIRRTNHTVKMAVWSSQRVSQNNILWESLMGEFNVNLLIFKITFPFQKHQKVQQ